MNFLETNYLNYIDENLEKIQKNINNLASENRNDEANLEKVKANIYNIFKTLFNVDKNQVKTQKNLNEKETLNLFCTSFLKRFDTIPNNWRSSLENAKNNGDTLNQVIEETKLAVADKLKDKFIEISKISY